MGSCYWGWETKGNRIAWGLVVTFVIIGAAFWIPGVVEVKKCINTFNACRCTMTANGWVCLNDASPNDKGRYDACYQQYSKCVKRPGAVWGVGWFFLILMSWLPCCYFCCCSKNPKSAGLPSGVQMAPMPAQPYNPYAGAAAAGGFPGGYPQAGQPGAAAYPTAFPTYTQNAYDSSVPVHRY